MNKTISINFGRPSHGWLPVDIRFDDYILEFEASDGLNDPLLELFQSITSVDFENTKDVTWWLEPGAYYFKFSKNNSVYSLTISEVDDLHDEEETPRVIKIINGSYQDIIDPFKKALVDFNSNTHEPDHWPYSLDKVQLKQISADT